MEYGERATTWDSVARTLAAALTDSVIAEAMQALPPAHYALVGRFLEGWLMARRDALPEAAKRFYRLLAAEVDVHATSGSDRASVSRLDDGVVQLALTAEGDSTPYLARRGAEPALSAGRLRVLARDREGLGSGVSAAEYLPHQLRQPARGERLLKEGDVGFLYPVRALGIARVAGDQHRLDPRPNALKLLQQIRAIHAWKPGWARTGSH